MAPAPAAPAVPVCQEKPRRRFAGLDALRGIAALAVCYDHFVVGSPGFLPESSWLHRANWVGPYGVYIFFVISGFIIPLSLARAGYRLRDAPRYLLRRMLRIDPPYLASMLLELGFVSLLSRLPHYHGGNLPHWYEVLGHVGYLNGLLGWRWVIPVYWTLAIEFQYYLGISLCFPLLFATSKTAANLTILAWSLLGLVLPAPALLFRYGSLFALGFILCRHLERRSTWLETSLLTLVALGGVAHAFGWLPVLIVIGAMTGIALWENPGAGWLFFGRISYSLYLVHGIVGFHLINGLVKFNLVHYPGPLVAWLVIGLAFACTVPAAWLFWRYVEWPAHRLAQSLPVRATAPGLPLAK